MINVKYTFDDLDNMLQEAIAIVEGCGIKLIPFIDPYVILTRDFTLWGIRYFPKKGPISESNPLRIGLSMAVLGNSRKSIMNTLIHEVLHCAEPYEKGHTERFLRNAEIVSEKTGYHISVRGNHDLQPGDKFRYLLCFQRKPERKNTRGCSL